MAENILIMTLLPVTALMLVTQVNPYQALIIRGILGAVAALVYALLGAADVALTEALVGTMLSITLYAIAVRSSMSLRLGVIQGKEIASENATSEAELLPETLANALRQGLQKHHLRLELVCYNNEQTLNEAIAQKEIHAIYHPPLAPLPHPPSSPQIQIRLPHLHGLLQSELSAHPVRFTLVAPPSPQSVPPLSAPPLSAPPLQEESS